MKIRYIIILITFLPIPCLGQGKEYKEVSVPFDEQGQISPNLLAPAREAIYNKISGEAQIDLFNNGMEVSSQAGQFKFTISDLPIKIRLYERPATIK